MGNVCISNRTLTPMEHGTFEYVLPPELIKAEVSTDLVEVQEKCATKIQAVYRGHSVRKLQKEVQESYVPQKSVAEETELVPDVHHHVVSKVLLQLGPFDWEKCDQMPGAQTLKPHKFVEQGGIYIGQWKDHKRNGRGQYIYPDGSLYEGFWQNDKANGFGRLVMTSGEYYVGQWKDDKMDGYGVYVHADQSKYEGQWKEDQRHGKGKEMWADDSAVYEGDFVMGIKEGFGTYKWGDKSSYDGQFKGGQFNGYGEYIWADDSKYAGQWQKNKMNGEGEMTWSDGRHYKGTSIQNMRGVTRTTRRMVTENLLGLIRGFTRECGQMDYNMVREYKLINMGNKSQESGMRDKEDDNFITTQVIFRFSIQDRYNFLSYSRYLSLCFVWGNCCRDTFSVISPVNFLSFK